MRTKSAVRAILVVTLLGCFISAQEARSESVFQAERARSLATLVIQPPSLAGGSSGNVVGAASYAILPSDSTQSVDIEVPEAKAHHPYKEIIGFAIVTAVVAYAAITIFAPDKATLKPDGSGKPVPPGTLGVGISVPLSR